MLIEMVLDELHCEMQSWFHLVLNYYQGELHLVKVKKVWSFSESSLSTLFIILISFELCSVRGIGIRILQRTWSRLFGRGCRWQFSCWGGPEVCVGCVFHDWTWCLEEREWKRKVCRCWWLFGCKYESPQFELFYLKMTYKLEGI